MRIRILGSAAGGRFPQWNCGCGNCVAVRENVRFKKLSRKARTQAQLALSADGSSWFLAGASPDLASQIESSPELHPRALRDSPIAGVVLASADLDHVLGLLVLRELQPLRVYAAPSILRILREENSMFGMLNRVEPQVIWTPMNSGAPFPLLTPEGNQSGLRCEVQYLSGRYPKYVKSQNLAALRQWPRCFSKLRASGSLTFPRLAVSVLRCLKKSAMPTCFFSTVLFGATTN